MVKHYLGRRDGYMCGYTAWRIKEYRSCALYSGLDATHQTGRIVESSDARRLARSKKPVQDVQSTLVDRLIDHSAIHSNGSTICKC